MAHPVWAQHKTELDELFLPKTQQQELTYKNGQKVHVLLSTQEVEPVLLHYLKLSRQASWRLTFPSQAEAVTWLNALKKSKQSKVFMLNLYNLKSKVNYSLTIGELQKTSDLTARSIITIYRMQDSFGS